VAPLRALLALRRLTKALADPRNRSLEDVFRDALDDGSLRVHFRKPETGEFLTADGDPAPLPNGDRRVVTRVGTGEQFFAAISHDPFLAEDTQKDRLEIAVAFARMQIARDADAASHASALHQARFEQVEALLEHEARTRDDIQRNLHDGVQSDLAHLGYLIGRAGDQLAGTEYAGLVEDARLSVLVLQRQLRDFVHGLSPTTLLADGLLGALAPLGADATVHLDVPDQRWSAAVEDSLYFIIKEAVTNAQKHAHATRIDVLIYRDHDHLVAEVRDDGVGVSESAIPGLGSRTMRVRAAQIGAAFDQKTRPGRGTTIRVYVPCESLSQTTTSARPPSSPPN
jgi:signal transduction histidine kinase